MVASARTSIRLTVALLDAVSARHRRLRAEISPLLDLHAAHLEVLDDGAEDEAVAAGLSAPTPAMARTQVADAENSLAGTLRDAARRASSGELARALASMSAAVSQRVIA